VYVIDDGCILVIFSLKLVVVKLSGFINYGAGLRGLINRFGFNNNDLFDRGLGVFNFFMFMGVKGVVRHYVYSIGFDFSTWVYFVDNINFCFG
jgi:hypothetical protein